MNEMNTKFPHRTATRRDSHPRTFGTCHCRTLPPAKPKQWQEPNPYPHKQIILDNSLQMKINKFYSVNEPQSSTF